MVLPRIIKGNEVKSKNVFHFAPKLEFLIVDPQNDFSDAPDAALPVTGAGADAERLAHLLERLRDRIDGIRVTLDTHQLLDIAHPCSGSMMLAGSRRLSPRSAWPRSRTGFGVPTTGMPNSEALARAGAAR